MSNTALLPHVNELVVLANVEMYYFSLIQAIKMHELSTLQSVVHYMIESSAQSIQHCLDVCVTLHGKDDQFLYTYPMTLLAFAGYYGRRHMMDFLISEGASKYELEI